MEMIAAALLFLAIFLPLATWLVWIIWKAVGPPLCEAVDKISAWMHADTPK